MRLIKIMQKFRTSLLNRQFGFTSLQQKGRLSQVGIPLQGELKSVNDINLMRTQTLS